MIPKLSIFSRSSPDMVAAIDLGSNSFHMIVARVQDGNLVIVDRIREMVRLAEGLGNKNKITKSARKRAVQCLERFGQRLREVKPENLRAVGTNTFRKAENAKEFLSAAEKALGHNIEIVSGMEEARLVYLGVARSLAEEEGKRLVIDIGGGSTELIVGKKTKPLVMRSIHIGCVGITEAFFPDGKITKKQIKRALLFAESEIEPWYEAFNSKEWNSCVGSSGTIRAIGRILVNENMTQDGITDKGLEKLLKQIEKLDSINEIRFEGLGKRRQPVFIGGLITLCALFRYLGITHMKVSDGAVREGVLYDLIGRARHEDIRQNSISHLRSRYACDQDQGERIKTTALDLFSQVKNIFPDHEEDAEYMLRWACEIHELGLDISHHQHQTHGAYILENADLMGFSRDEQKILATIVRNHRGQFFKTLYDEFLPPWNRTALTLTILLRISVILHRSRSKNPLPGIRLRIDKSEVTLHFPGEWLTNHPLTGTDLEQEAGLLKKTGYKLDIVS